MIPQHQSTDTELFTPEEAAQGIIDNLVGSGYSLSDRVAISMEISVKLTTSFQNRLTNDFALN